MLDAARKCWELLPPGLRWGMFGLFLLMNLQALAQMGMVGSFLPFLQAISDPNQMENSQVFRTLHALIEPLEDTTILFLLGGFVIAAVLFANFLGAIQSILTARFASKLNAHLSTLLLRSYLSESYLFFLHRNSSDFLRDIFSEVDLVSSGFLQTGMNALARLLTIAALSLLLILINPWIAIGAGSFFAASYTGIYFLLRPRLVHASEKRAEFDSLRYKAVTESFGTIKELKVLRREANFVRAFEEPSRRYFRYVEKAQLYAELPRNLVETIAFAGMVGVALLLLQQYGGVTGALPVLGIFAVAGYRLLPAIKTFYTACSHLRYARASVDTVHRECAPLLRKEAETRGLIQNEASAKNDELRLPLLNEIELKEVSFAYPGSAYSALRNVNLKIPARSRIGFCGKSGSGKTTLADIVLGLLQPQTGVITVDGVKVDDSNNAKWQRNCGYVPQQIYLTDDTIRRNIAFGIAPDQINEDQVQSAARISNIDTFIETELPEGYETKVGERGIRLSGGQRQRIGIARALYHDPEVIVLDEATSSLDPETERAIVEAVQSLSGRKTIFMIAHRLSTIRQSDMVVFVENGVVTASGSYEELLSSNEPFRRLATL